MEIGSSNLKWQKVYDYLKREIVSGNIGLGSRLAPARELAEKFNVSKRAVQSAFKTLEAENVVKTHVGKGTFVTTNMETMTSKMILLVLGGFNDEHALLPKRLCRQLQEDGYYTNIFEQEINNSASFRRNLEAMLKEEPKALIIDASSYFPFDILINVSNKTKLIFINRFEGEKLEDASYILEDYRYGGYMATKHLIDIGKKKIAVDSFERNKGWTTDLFMTGCEQALNEAGLRLHSYNLHRLMTDADYVKMFKSKNKPDAILAFPVFYAVKIVENLRALSSRYFDDIAVIGYGDTPWAQAYGITSICEPIDEMVALTQRVLNEDVTIDCSVKPTCFFRKTCPEKFEHKNDELPATPISQSYS